MRSPFCQVVIGMDVAASEFYGTDKTYDLNFKEEVSLLSIFFAACTSGFCRLIDY